MGKKKKKKSISAQKQRPSSHSENSTARGRSSVFLKLGFIFTTQSPPVRRQQNQPCPARGSAGRRGLSSGLSLGGSEPRSAVHRHLHAKLCSRISTKATGGGHCRGVAGLSHPSRFPGPSWPGSPHPAPSESRAHGHSPQSEIITFCFGFPSLVP